MNNEDLLVNTMDSMGNMLDSTVSNAVNILVMQHVLDLLVNSLGLPASNLVMHHPVMMQRNLAMMVNMTVMHLVMMHSMVTSRAQVNWAMMMTNSVTFLMHQMQLMVKNLVRLVSFR